MSGVLSALAGAFFGSLVATAIVARLTQKWIEGRERRGKRDDLRLELYLEIVDAVLDNELVLAKRGMQGELPPSELQRKRIGISHRLRLLGSPAVRKEYEAYTGLVFQETAQDLEFRAKDPKEVDRARDKLVVAMAEDVQEGEGD